jgi:hypothetical protein
MINGVSLPDYYVKDTDSWRVFPHGIHRVTKEEILAHQPVAGNFSEDL